MIVHLISVKSLPVLMYGPGARPVCVSDKRSLDFIITRTLMKIFQTSSVDVVQECQTMFNFRRVSEMILERKRKFLQKFCSCENGICQVLALLLHLYSSKNDSNQTNKKERKTRQRTQYRKYSNVHAYIT